MQQTTASIYRLDPEKAASVRTNPPHNMTVFEAAAYVGVSPRKLRDLLTAGRIKHARLGAKIIVTRTALDEALRSA